jgi:hypothetical protein
VPDATASAPTIAEATSLIVAANANAATPSSEPSAQPSSAPEQPPVQLVIGAVTPLDVTTRVLLNPAWKPTTKAAKTKSSETVKPVLTAIATAPVVRIAYQPRVDPKHPGRATIRITNTGNAPLVVTRPLAADPTPAPSEPAAAAPSAEPKAAPTAGAVLLVTAVPAWGPAAEPVVLSIPLHADLAPGKSLDIAVALPASQVGQSSYLLVARVVWNVGHHVFAPTLFWLRSAPATPGTRAKSTDPALASIAASLATNSH